MTKEVFTSADEIDQRLLRWAENVSAPHKAVLGSPTEGDKAQATAIHLLEIINTPPARGTGQAPVTLCLRYLITVGITDQLEAHKVIGELMLEAVGVPGFEVETTPLPLYVWRSFGCAPRPALLVRVALVRERSITPAPLVKKPLRVELSPKPPQS